jgi:hypothetical protein
MEETEIEQQALERDLLLATPELFRADIVVGADQVRAQPLRRLDCDFDAVLQH